MCVGHNSDNTIKINGLNIQWNHHHDIAALLEVLVMDVYKLKNIRKGEVVLDLGAGIGEFSLICSRLVGPEGLVIAIEPNPQDFQCLISNIDNNRIRNVVAVNKAFSEDGKNVDLEFKGQVFSAQGIDTNGIYEILKLHNTGGIDIIKMDIEGAEVIALRNLTSELKRVRSIAIELHETEKEVNEMLTPMGFQFYRLKRHQYLFSSIKFALSHLLTAYRLWKLFTRSGENPGLLKIAGGIDISNSPELQVGIYAKTTGDN